MRTRASVVGLALATGLAAGPWARAEEAALDAAKPAPELVRVTGVRVADPGATVAEADVKAAVAAQLPALTACAAKRKAPAATEAVAWLVFDKKGKAVEATLAGTGDAKLHACAAKALRAARLATPGKQKVAVTVDLAWDPLGPGTGYTRGAPSQHDRVAVEDTYLVQWLSVADPEGKLTGELDVPAFLATRAKALNACHKKHSKKNSLLAVEAVWIGFDAKGKATTVKAAGSGVASFDACVAGAFAKQSLKVAAGRPVAIAVRFFFDPTSVQIERNGMLDQLGGPHDGPGIGTLDVKKGPSPSLQDPGDPYRVPSPRSKVSADAGIGDGDLEGGEVVKNVLRYRGMLASCHVQRLKVDPTILKFAMVLRVRVDGAGMVTQAEVHGVDVGLDEVAACVRKVAQRMRFPKPGVDDAAFQVKLRFVGDLPAP